MIRFSVELHGNWVDVALDSRRKEKYMLDFRHRQLRWASAAIMTLGLLILPETGFAGLPQLLSSWVCQPPQIDGEISAGEWSAPRIDLGDGVTARIANDAHTLYLSVLDSRDLSYDIHWDVVILAFDDEGGTAPLLEDYAFANPACQLTPDLGEGYFYFSWDQHVFFKELTRAATCEIQFSTDRIFFRSGARPEGVTYEAAIPLDGLSALRAGPGERFGMQLLTFRDAALVGCLPNCVLFDPEQFLDLVLATGSCNSGP